MTPLGTVLLSGVRHAASYLPVLLANPDVKVLGICEEESVAPWIREGTLAVCKAFDLPFLGEPAPVLAQPTVQLAVVCAEPTRHARLAIQALKAGKHVLVDKPVAANLDEATLLLETARLATGKCTVMNRLASPPVARAIKQIQAGHLGLVLHLDIEFLANGTQFNTSVERPELVVDPVLSGGGELANFLVYPVDYIRHLSGVEIVEVYAGAGSFFFEPHRRFGVEDLTVLSLKLENGLTATVTVGRIPAAPTASPIASTIRITGSHGHLTVAEDQPRLEVWTDYSNERSRPIGPESGEVAVKAAINNFIDDILQNRNPHYGPTDALATQAVTHAAYRSLKTGQPEAVTSNPFERIKA